MGEFLFSGLDRYDTPESNRPSPVFRMLLGSRWYFYWRNFGIFIAAGRLAAGGQLDRRNQIILSQENLKLVERCGGRVHVRGLNFIRNLAGKPAVIAGNHMSLLETAAVHSLIREYTDFSFVIKESLLRTPFMKDILKSFDAIPVTRTNPREDLKTILTEGKKLLLSGHSLVIFPQSTRTRNFEPEQFNSIAVKLARAAGVPLVPLALKTDFVDNGRILRDLGPVHPERDVWFEFGAPLTVTGNGQEQQHALVEFIRERLAAWNGGSQPR